MLEEPDSTDVETWRAAARKPFKAGDPVNDGDARIWATVLRAAEADEIILVSNNPKDFAASRKAATDLHHELRGDLVARGLDADRVQLAPSCGYALHLLGAPDVPTAEAADRLERGKGKSRLLAKAVEAFQSTVIDDEEADALGLGVDLDPESVYVDAFDPSSLEVLSAFELATRRPPSKPSSSERSVSTCSSTEPTPTGSRTTAQSPSTTTTTTSPTRKDRLTYRSG